MGHGPVAGQKNFSVTFQLFLKNHVLCSFLDANLSIFGVCLQFVIAQWFLTFSLPHLS